MADQTGFNKQTSEANYDIHIIAQLRDGNVADIATGLDQTMASYYQNHANLPEIDAQKLHADDILKTEPVAGATYFEYDTFKAVAAQDYNRTMYDATKIFKELMKELDPGREYSRDFSKLDANSITDPNENNWEYTFRELQGARNAYEGDFGSDKLVARADLALKALENAGGMATTIANFNFQEVKPLDPWQDVAEKQDLSPYIIDDSAGGAGLKIVKPN